MAQILITDDNPQNLYLARLVIEKAGHRVHEAFNGQQAIEACRKNHYDIVLMDIQMPVVNGIEAAKEIKLIDTKSVIIALTSKAMRGDREEIISSGCDDYIAKPFTLNTLRDRINHWLAKNAHAERIL